ncbi:adenosylcobalamin-dependent ribonucleoside-diphosphate reductase [Rubrivivax gelatinosus]|uniref:adenosylcobalamin-dependent ribonucleoside-diphosphate reductase n=1 Tax=Rubrivivax gelatinosus TaxID=28068 RepID=UPI0002EAF7FB|nr:adenosylcobalamin-dependent ribonucleoside-diphosphate reductase [Rubrivivax gelatinosus]MBG6082988.1 ribonucleoside-diphosphate reductase alpha chain [Rubrivivax gelatinosus]
MDMKEQNLSAALAPQQVTVDTLLEKYAKSGETSATEIYARVAAGVAAAEPEHLRARYKKEFFDNMVAGAIGAGRIMSAAGTGIRATLANCFVQPVGDAVMGTDEDGYPGIYVALLEAAETMRRGGGVGYDMSRIRPKGAFVKGTHSSASGPCSYMDVFDKSCQTVESAGARRGAQMGVLRIDHPDILEFITAKREPGRWNNFNVSVGIVEGFMQAVQTGADWQLVHKAEPAQAAKDAGAFRRDDGLWVYKTVPAKQIWDTIMRSTYEFAEPGILFLDNMNRDNNLRYCETIEATNPCAEEPLPKYGCCDLGPVILPNFVRNAFTASAEFDYAAFAAAVALQVRFLDNVLDVTHWPLPQQQEEAHAKRRIGVGYTGLGDALIMLNLRYDSEQGREAAGQITRCMRDAAYTASTALAAEKGAFPKFDAAEYLAEGTFASRLPESIKAEIRAHGIRNSHLLAIAPTGTVSLAFADNASGGIEPAFSLAYNRKKRLKEGGHAMYAVKDHAFRVFSEKVCEPKLRDGLIAAVCNYNASFDADGKTYAVKDVLPSSFVTALEMPASEHLAMMRAVQPYIDTSISKTVNVPEDYPYDDFKGLYMAAWRAGLKGLATYRPNSILGSVLSVGAPAPASTPAAAPAPLAEDDPLRKQFDNRREGELEGVTSKVEYMTHEGKRSVYLVVNFQRVDGIVGGKPVTIERPVEFFMPAGQMGEGQQWISSNMRLLSMVARSGGSVAKALTNMREVVWDKGQVRCGLVVKDDGGKVPMFHDSEVAAIGYALQRILIKRGFLDSVGNQVPVRKLAERLARRDEEFAMNDNDPAAASRPPGAPTLNGAGKKCPECGAHELHKVDGCHKCSNCGHVGSCG